MPSYLGVTPSFVAGILATLFLAAFDGSATEAPKLVVASPGEAGLRAALNRVAAGGTVIFTDSIQLEAPIALERSVTIQYGGPLPWGNSIGGYFEGALFSVAAP